MRSTSVSNSGGVWSYTIVPDSRLDGSLPYTAIATGTGGVESVTNTFTASAFRTGTVPRQDLCSIFYFDASDLVGNANDLVTSLPLRFVGSDATGATIASTAGVAPKINDTTFLDANGTAKRTLEFSGAQVMSCSTATVTGLVAGLATGDSIYGIFLIRPTASGAANAYFGWGNTSGTDVVVSWANSTTYGVFARATGGSSGPSFSTTARENQTPQIVVWKWTKTASGFQASFWRSGQPDGGGPVTITTGIPNLNVFTIGALNINGVVGNFDHGCVQKIWMTKRTSGNDLTQDQIVEIGALMAADWTGKIQWGAAEYSWILQAGSGQSNEASQAVADPSDLETSDVQSYMQVLSPQAWTTADAGIVNMKPRSFSGTNYVGAWYFWSLLTYARGLFAHAAVAAQGSTASSAWLRNAASDGVYTTDLWSLVRRTISFLRVMIGGSPSKIVFEWDQYEQDVQGAVSTATYQSNVQTIYNELVAMFGTFDFLIVLTNTHQTTTFGGPLNPASMALISAAQTNLLGANPTMKAIDASSQDTPINTHLHYDRSGQQFIASLLDSHT